VQRNRGTHTPVRAGGGQECTPHNLLQDLVNRTVVYGSWLLALGSWLLALGSWPDGSMARWLDGPMARWPDGSCLLAHGWSCRAVQSPIRNPQSAIPNPQSPIRNPQSPIRNPQSTIRNPQSAIPHPQSPIRNPPARCGLPIPKREDGQRPAPYHAFVTSRFGIA
jgi:hypothetical protein